MHVARKTSCPLLWVSLQLCGLGLIVVGILVQIGLHSTYQIQDASASGVPIVIIAVGVVIFFVAFFGCCGAWKENYCMITTVLPSSTTSLPKFICRNNLAGICV